MINFETRRKLKGLKIFLVLDCWRPTTESRFKTCPFYLLPIDERPVNLGMSCKKCEYCLPVFTLEELIEAIELKVGGWEDGAYEIECGMDIHTSTKYYSVFLYKKVKLGNMQTANSLDNCLAKALIWLSEQEE